MALLGLLAAAFAVQLLGVFRRNINWDEFLFLSNVYAVPNGDRSACCRRRSPICSAG
jgi:hypothetical protein